VQQNRLENTRVKLPKLLDDGFRPLSRLVELANSEQQCFAKSPSSQAKGIGPLLLRWNWRGLDGMMVTVLPSLRGVSL